MSLACAGVLAASCTVGPDYEKPKIETTVAYKEAGDWVVANPSDAVPKGKWWEVFQDPILNGLVEQVSVSNPSLAAAEARYRQARAAVAGARAGFFPTIGASGGATRGRRGEAGSTTSYDIGLDARWEVDLWGRVRRTVEAARAGEEASAADLENARLSLQAEVAINYFQLRVTDVQAALLEDTIKALQTSFDIASNRYQAGVAGKVDVVQAETQVKSSQAQAIDLKSTRAQLEHAIAVLVGKQPAEFALAPEPTYRPHIPAIPPGVPSTLLERRPDVAAAERRMAAANARIGVAQAAYYPSLSLSGSGGFASGALSTLISAPSRVWSLGLGLAGTLIDFGARRADVEASRAAYDEAAANYRQTVLEALQEVEDDLADVRYLAEGTRVQQDAARLARESVVLTLNQYKSGTVGYLNVALVQATQFNQERQTIALVGRQLVSTVGLVRALGGSW